MELALDAVYAVEVAVTVRGLLRELLLTVRGEVAVSLEGYPVWVGLVSSWMWAVFVGTPEAESVVAVDPDRVKLSLEPAAEVLPPIPDGSDGSEAGGI
jgi:hypothetical protein